MQSQSMTRYGRLAIGAACAALALAACSKKADDTATTTTSSETAGTGGGNAATMTTTSTTTTAAAAPAADNTDTLSGAKLASFTGDATKGEAVFVQCKTCHDVAVNKIGPHLQGVVGRKAGSIADFSYSAANKNSGITWTPEKLFQYLEKPQRVVPGTKMTFAGISDPQKRADLIAYLGTLK